MTEPTPPAVDDRPLIRAIVSGTAACLFVGGVALTIVVLGIVTPRFNEIFGDFGVEVSPVMLAIFQTSNALHQSGPLGIAAALAVSAGAAAGLSKLLWDRPLVLAILAAVFVLLPIVIHAMHFDLLMDMREALEQGGAA